MATLTNSANPWWNFPRIDNFGTIDPQGNYWKPDTNVQIPGNYPIVAILSGTVTDVSRTSYGQSMVTVKLDNPLNNLATHTFYEHMSSATVSVGQHVSQGTLIGYNNPAGQVPLGFGLYSGDQYGSGSAWTVLQNDLKPGGAGLLNPVSLIEQVASGHTPAGGNIPTSGGTSSTGTSNWATSLLGAVGLPSGADVQNFVQRLGLVFLGGLLLIVGILVLFLNSDTGKKAVSTAAKAAAA